MTFRARLLLGFGVVVLVPLAVFGLGARQEMGDRVTAEYERRVAALTEILRADLARRGTETGERLDALKRSMAEDNRLRLAVLQGADRGYLLDYAGRAMALAGLAMLQIQDDDGRIVSSGHFRNEYDRREPALPVLLGRAPGGVALVPARRADGPFTVLARLDSLRLGGRRFTLIGGVEVDTAFLRRLAPDPALTVSLALPGDTLGGVPDTAARVAGELDVPYVNLASGVSGLIVPARLVVTHSLAPLTALRRGVDRWFAAGVAAAGGAALLLGVWLAGRITRPLRVLAERTADIDLDRPEVTFEAEREDEVGALARLLNQMTERIRAGSARLRDVERRAAMGDLARQVNHDVKNGLVPIRNVFRHLAAVAREQPAELPAVFAERLGTIESSVAYLETLAANYARLSPQPSAGPCNVNGVVRDVVRRAGEGAGEREGEGERGVRREALRMALADGPLPAHADELAVRRIVENLVSNGLDALDGRPGSVTVATERAGAMVRITVADTGKGMSRAELARAFDDFHTTKPGGTGLGLSIVRRLVLDAGGSVRVETEPGAGSRFFVELPAEGGAP